LSYTLLGHSLTFAPRPLLAALLLVHLIIAAYWIGSLPPLAWVARRDGPQAAHLIEDWARIAAQAVPLLIAAGLRPRLLESRRSRPDPRHLVGPDASHQAAAGRGAARLRGLASLPPDAGHGRRHPGAGARLARSITAKAIVAILVLHAAAEMVSTSPESVVQRPH
jgi:putative copper export protein